MNKTILLLFLFTISFSTFAQKKDSITIAKRKARNDSLCINRFNEGNKHFGLIPVTTFEIGNKDYDSWTLGLKVEYGYFIKTKLLAYINNISSYGYEAYEGEENYSIGSNTAIGFRYYLAKRRYTIFGQGHIYYGLYNSNNTINKIPITDHIMGTSVGLGHTLFCNWFDVSMYVDYLFPFYVNEKANSDEGWEFYHKGLQLSLNVSFTF